MTESPRRVRARRARLFRLEGRPAFPAHLTTAFGRPRQVRLGVVTAVVGTVVAVLFALATQVGPGVAVLLGIAAGGLAVYMSARVFLVRDAATTPGPDWRHDGILVRETDAVPLPLGSEAEAEAGLLAADLAVPLRRAAAAAAVRAVWGVVIGWAQCAVGAALFVAALLGLPGTPWIVVLVAFIVGALGQDGAFRALAVLGRTVVAERLADTAGADTAGADAEAGAEAAPASEQ